MKEGKSHGGYYRGSKNKIHLGAGVVWSIFNGMKRQQHNPSKNVFWEY